MVRGRGGVREEGERESEVCVTFPLTLLLSPSFVFLDYLFKFLVIGNAGVGKSCLLHQFIEHKCKRERSTSSYTLKSQTS